MGNWESTYTDGSHDDSLHELPSHAGTSMDSYHQPKQQSAYIADNFNSLDQVLSTGIKFVLY